MPTYAYACTACDHRFDVQQAFTDAALTQCPECDGRLRKLFNAVGIVFKGSGFYRTDSRSGNGSALGTSSNSSSKESSSSGSSDKTPAGSSSSSDGSGGSSTAPATVGAGSSTSAA